MTTAALPTPPAYAGAAPGLTGLGVVDRLPGIDLDTVNARAALQHRYDAKYLLTPSTYRRFVEHLAWLGDWSCLTASDPDGRARRSFGYRSVYFDTGDLATARWHRQGRRRRYKIRSRTYRDSGICMFEVKLKGAREVTVKERLPQPLADAGRLTDPATRFLAEVLHRAYRTGPPTPLVPTLFTEYRRHTLVDPAAGTRVTCDVGFTCGRMPGPSETRPLCTAARPLCAVETKAVRPGGPVDRLLWSLSARPIRISKYCVAAAVLFPGFSANPWHPALRRWFSPAAS